MWAEKERVLSRVTPRSRTEAKKVNWGNCAASEAKSSLSSSLDLTLTVHHHSFIKKIYIHPTSRLLLRCTQEETSITRDRLTTHMSLPLPVFFWLLSTTALPMFLTASVSVTLQSSSESKNCVHCCDVRETESRRDVLRRTSHASMLLATWSNRPATPSDNDKQLITVVVNCHCQSHWQSHWQSHCQKSLSKVTDKSHCQKSLSKVTDKSHCQSLCQSHWQESLSKIADKSYCQSHCILMSPLPP